MHKILCGILKIEMLTTQFVAYRKYKKLETQHLMFPNFFVQHFSKYLIEVTTYGVHFMNKRKGKH